MKLPLKMRLWLIKALQNMASRDTVASFGCTILTKNGRHIEVGHIDGGAYVIVDGKRVE